MEACELSAELCVGADERVAVIVKTGSFFEVQVP